MVYFKVVFLVWFPICVRLRWHALTLFVIFVYVHSWFNFIIYLFKPYAFPFFPEAQNKLLKFLAYFNQHNSNNQITSQKWHNIKQQVGGQTIIVLRTAKMHVLYHILTLKSPLRTFGHTGILPVLSSILFLIYVFANCCSLLQRSNFLTRLMKVVIFDAQWSINFLTIWGGVQYFI